MFAAGIFYLTSGPIRNLLFAFCSPHNSCSLCFESSYTLLDSVAAVQSTSHTSFAVALDDNGVQAPQQTASLP